MKESTNDINEIIIRYLDGSAALEEKMLLLRWLKQSDGNRDDFAVTRFVHRQFILRQRDCRQNTDN